MHVLQRDAVRDDLGGLEVTVAHRISAALESWPTEATSGGAISGFHHPTAEVKTSLLGRSAAAV
jgi:hypothetical protein